jgi:hypothetical protein
MEYAQLRILLFLRVNTVFGVEGVGDKEVLFNQW